MKRSKLVFWGFIMPACVVYFIFMVYPMVSSIILSLFQWNGFGAKTFVGLENYKTLFGNPEYMERFGNAFKNNVYFFIVTLILQNGIGLMLAAFLNNKNIKGQKFFRALFYVPSILSLVVVGYIWQIIYNPLWGPLNDGLSRIGLESLKMAWLGKESTALTAITIANAWQYTGVPMIMLLAGMQNVPDDLYEAAALDGASGWKSFWKITFPLISPVMFMVSVITFVGNFSAFEIVYTMASSTGDPNYATDILGTFFYRICFGTRMGLQPNMGLGAAIATIIFALIAVAMFFYFRSFNKESDL